jgi:hypothetical protein
MKNLLEKLKPHQQTILADLKEIGYTKVYIAEPMTNRPLTELTFLVEAKDEDSLPSQVPVDILRGKIEKLVGVPSCMILNKAALEEKITKGNLLDKDLYGNTLESAQLLTLEKVKPFSREATPTGVQSKKRKPSSEVQEECSQSNNSVTLFIPHKVPRKDLLGAIIKQLCANSQVVKIIEENPHILQEVDQQFISSPTECLTSQSTEPAPVTNDV